jgi:hypothetical protein
MKQYKFNFDCPFWEQLADKERVTVINGVSTPMAYYNLILCIRDCALYSKGIKPHRFWKISHVKNYFGIKGSASSMKEQLELIRDYLTQKTEQ